MRLAWLVLAGCGRIGFDSPPPVPPVDEPQLALGSGHACLRTAAGAVWCWGRNLHGQLGLGAAAYPTNQKLPQQVATQTTWSDIAPGNMHTCALDEQGRAWCWGFNSSGQLGIAPETCGNAILDPGETCDDGNNANNDGCNCLCQTTPAVAPDVVAPTLVSGARTYRRIYSGADFSCAIATDGSIWCWGDNGHGELGTGDSKNRSFPHQVGTATNWIALDLGNRDTCGIQDDQSLWCWGNNMFGQLGESTKSSLPGLVQAGSTWREVGAGGDYVCAVGDDQRLYCLGRNDSGQLGLGDLQQRSTPTINADRLFDRVAGGLTHACGRGLDGSLWCWGDDDAGEIGIGTTGTTPVPLSQVVGTWTAVAAGSGFTCALDDQAAPWCWGNGSFGNLGNGTFTDVPSPVLVELP